VNAVAKTIRAQVDKVNRYKWVSRNERGKLAYVDKKSLQIDHRYQRALSDPKRLRIASNFNWAAFGVLTVARRTDGSLWVIDGQHRLAAAMSRDDIDTVPVVIFEFNGNIMDEATDFLINNKERRPLAGVDAFKAQVVAGDPTALQVQDLLTAGGRTVGAPGPRTVSCVKALYACMKEDAGALKRIWPIIVEICAGKPIDYRLLHGMHLLETRLVDSTGKDRSLTETDNRRKLIAEGSGAIIRSIGNAVAFYAHGGHTVFARGILSLLNWKRKKRLMLKGDMESAPEPSPEALEEESGE
jgi:hypothetical protein